MERRSGISRRDWLAIAAGIGLLFVVRELSRQRVEPGDAAPAGPGPAELLREARRAQVPERLPELSADELDRRRALVEEGLERWRASDSAERAAAVAVAYPLAVATLLDHGAAPGELLDEPPTPDGASGGFARQRHSFEVDGRWYRIEALDFPEFAAWERALAEEGGADPLAPEVERAVEERLLEALELLGPPR